MGKGSSKLNSAFSNDYLVNIKEIIRQVNYIKKRLAFYNIIISCKCNTKTNTLSLSTAPIRLNPKAITGTLWAA